MGKGPNKATRKLIKKGKLDHTSRVAHLKKKGGLNKAGKGKPAVGGKVGGKPDHGKKGFKGAGKKDSGARGQRPKTTGQDEPRAAQPQDEEAGAGGIEEMDVDAFMNGGMFGLDVDENGKQYDEGSETEEGTEDEEGEEGEEDEKEDDDELLNGGDDTENNDDSGSGSEDDEAADEMTKHKAQLEELKKRDPDFFKFLENNDQNLLNFGDGDDSSEDDEDDEGDDEEGGKEGEGEEMDEGDEDDEEGAPQPETQELTMALLQGLERAAIEQHSIKALRKLVQAFRAASTMADEQSRGGKGAGPYSIVNSSVFDRLLVISLSNLPDVFGYHILGTSDFAANDPAAFAKMATSAPFKRIKPIVYRCLKSLHYLLNQVTDTSLLSFIISCLERFVPFLIPFPRMAKHYLKTLLNLWSSSDAMPLKLAAFLRIRQLAITQPFPFLEHCLKGLYLSYVRYAKFMTEASLPSLTFMGNCLVELYGLDMTSSYQHAFVYLRQLALHLRAACTKKTKEALQKVQSWQYLNCLRAWAAILVAYPQPDQLADLFFPLIQIILGVARLSPSARYYPLLFHCVNLLQRLAGRAKCFVPTASLLLDVLENPALVKKPKATTEAGPNLHMAIRLGKDLLDPKIVQDHVVGEALDLLNQEVLLYRYTIAFPEYAFSIKDRLRRFQKAVKPPRWKALAKGLVEDMDKRSAYVSLERTKRELAPTDVHGFEALLPKGEPVAYERVRVVMDAKLAKLLAASASAVKNQTNREEEEDEEEEVPKGKKGEKKAQEPKAKKEQKAKKAKGAAVVANGDVDGLEDEVGELGAWSDDEEEESEGEEDGEEMDQDDDEEEEEDDEEEDDE